MVKKSRNLGTELRRSEHSFADTDTLNLPSRYHMLGIGIDKYKDSGFGQPLNLAADEVRSMADLLQAQYGFQDSINLINEQATATAIYDALADFSPTGKIALNNDHALLVYFAGHGGIDKNERQSFFAPFDAYYGHLSRWYSHSDFIEQLGAIEARYILLIANSCFSGGLIRDHSELAGESLPFTELFGQRSREIITSGKKDQEVSDNSSFALALRRALRDSSTPWLSSDTLHTQVRDHVLIQDGHRPIYGVFADKDLKLHRDARFIFQRRAFVVKSQQPTASKPISSSAHTLRPQSTQQPQRHFSKNPDLQAIVDNDVLIRGGSFLMGSPKDEQDRHSDEGRQRQVQVPSFYLGRYPVTRGEYARFARAMGSSIDDEWRNSRFKQGDDHPVVRVRWKDAQTYIEWLNLETGLLETGLTYRLPSEAEWEYACRAGISTRFWWGDDAKLAHLCANYGRKHNGTTAVGSFKPNPWGLYDMSGNVWEWVQDCWNSSYSGAPSDGSAWLSGDCSLRFLRGGSWFSYPGYLRSANRYRLNALLRYNYLGFRLARTLD